MKGNKIMISRAPVLTLWAGVVAERIAAGAWQGLSGAANKMPLGPSWRSICGLQ